MCIKSHPLDCHRSAGQSPLQETQSTAALNSLNTSSAGFPLVRNPPLTLLSLHFCAMTMCKLGIYTWVNWLCSRHLSFYHLSLAQLWFKHKIWVNVLNAIRWSDDTLSTSGDGAFIREDLGRCLAQLVKKVSHLQRLCRRCRGPRFNSRPGSICCMSIPLSSCFLSKSSAVLSIKPKGPKNDKKK